MGSEMCIRDRCRDSEANRTRAELSKKAKVEAKERQKGANPGEAEAKEHNLRGHIPEKVLQLSGIRSGWRCKLCRKAASKKNHLISRKCQGDPTTKWSKIVTEEDEPMVLPIQQHTMMALSLIHI